MMPGPADNHLQEKRTMRVLLVDDEEELASALAERLNMRGIKTDWATNCEEALQKATDNAYDLAVLDMKMPKTCGLELRTLLQKHCPRMKFIFVTGYVSEIDFKEVACQAGEECYLVKPVDIKLLIERTHDLLDAEEGAP
jgi:DNA-binding response OmpR family regulator